MKTLFAILILSAACFAQTSKSCTATGYCGNSTTNNGTDSGDSGVAIGMPFTVNAGYGLTECKIVMGAGGTSHDMRCFIVKDSNSAGATIGGSANVICASATVTATESAANVIPISGCGTLLTSTRYWMFLLNFDSSLTYVTTTTSTPTGGWYLILGAYPNAGGTVTGTATDFAHSLTQGITLTGSGPPPGQFARQQ